MPEGLPPPPSTLADPIPSEGCAACKVLYVTLQRAREANGQLAAEVHRLRAQTARAALTAVPESPRNGAASPVASGRIVCRTCGLLAVDVRAIDGQVVFRHADGKTCSW